MPIWMNAHFQIDKTTTTNIKAINIQWDDAKMWTFQNFPHKNLASTSKLWSFSFSSYFLAIIRIVLPNKCPKPKWNFLPLCVPCAMMWNGSGEPDSTKARFCQGRILCPKRKWGWCMLESAFKALFLPLTTMIYSISHQIRFKISRVWKYLI